MHDDILLREDDGAVATLTLNSPSRLNALSEAMLDALEAALAALAGEDGIRAVVLKGAGRAFCAGHDLREMTEARQAEDGGLARFEALFAKCSRVMLAITRLPQPVVAEVQGIATAAGCQLVATCDLAVAAEDARFGVNGVDIGLFCSTPMVALTRTIPRKRAFELLTTGAFLDAAEARGTRSRQPGGAAGGSSPARRRSSPRRSRASSARRSDRQAGLLRAGGAAAGRGLCAHRAGDGRQHDAR